jgi:hypothetical protein
MANHLIHFHFHRFHFSQNRLSKIIDLVHSISIHLIMDLQPQGSHLSGSKDESISIEQRTFYGDTTPIIKEAIAQHPTDFKIGFS